MTKLQLSVFCHIVRSLEKTIMLGSIEGSRKRRRLIMRWIDSVIDAMVLSFEQG